jgi:hypothetical protein
MGAPSAGLVISVSLALAMMPAVAGSAWAQIVPPFTSFTPVVPPMGQNAPPPHPPPPIPPPVPVPFPIWGWGAAAAPAQAPSNVNVIVNPAPPAPPPPVVYNPPTTETTAGGIDVVRCMSTSPGKP